MSYIVLARKYRPQTFAEVYAQEHITEILHNAITGNRIAHAYLFTGPRGVGKTSMARILAKSLNCVEGPTTTPCNKCHNCQEITSGTASDVIEIDGASNTGVDDIRELQRELMYAPSQAKYKIYIIDEVHMLSKSAFNALLKTLEEPPENVLFIFATTEPHKVLPTIISRCQRYDFKRIPVEAIVKRLKDLTAEENIEIDSESLYLIARKADGGLRDALSLLDQVLSYCVNKVSIDKVRGIFSMIPNQIYSRMLILIEAGDSAELIRQLHQIFEQGLDLQELITNMMEFLRVVLLRKTGLAPADVNTDEYPLYDEVAQRFSQNTLLYIMSYMMQARNDIKTSTNPYLILEMVMIKLCRMDDMEDIAGMLRQVKSGATPAVSPSIRSVKQEIPRSVASNAIPPIVETPIPAQVVDSAVPKALFDADGITNNWDRICNRCKKISHMTGLAISTAKCEIAGNDRLRLIVASNTHNNALQGKKEEVERILCDVFDRQVKLEIVLLQGEAPTKVEIKRVSLDEVKQKDPVLAQYIEKTDSVLGTGQ